MALEIEKRGADQPIDGNHLIGARQRIEKEKGAVEGEENGDEDIVVENPDGARLRLRGRIGDLQGG